MTNKERNELAYQAFLCAYNNPDNVVSIEENRIYLYEEGRISKKSIKILSNYYFPLGRVYYLKGYIGDYNFEISRRKEVKKFMQVINAKREKEQQEKDEHLKSLLC